MSSDAIALPFVGLASSSDAVALASSSAVHWVRTDGSSSASTPATMFVPGNANGTFVRQLAMSSDGTYVATISDDKGLRIYTLNAESGVISLESTRFLTKKASDLSFTAESDILVSDKVGDCYLYPLTPKAIPAEEAKRKKLDVQADPTLNPEATFLMGHVSVLTSHVLTDPLDLEGTGRKRRVLITADRDEHIRVTRYPETFVIERYLFGTDGFVSSIHIPTVRGAEVNQRLLISGGGEGILRIWDWQAGKQLGSVAIDAAVLPHRAARSTLRKDKRRNKGGSRKEPGDAFYSVPEGWMLPSGQGICVKHISSLRIGGSTVVLFFSEGAAAVHSFVLPSDPSSSLPASAVQTLPTSFPVLDYTPVPGTSDQILLSLDTTFGTVAFNQDPSQPKRDSASAGLTEEQKAGMAKPFRVVQIGADGTLTDISSSSSSASALLSTLESLRITTDKPHSLSNLNLYPNLSLYPRWPGLEEDDDLAGPAPGAIDDATGAGSPAPVLASAGKKEYTQDEYAAMNLKTLGRLKSQGYNVEAVMKVKRRETKDRRYEAKRRRLDAGLTEPSKEEQDLAAEGEGVAEDAEAEAEEEEGLNA